VSSAEFRLSVECCRWAFAPDSPEKIDALCAAVDWSKLLRVARFHRVQALVWNALRANEAKLPPETVREFSSDTEVIVATNLNAAVEMRELQSALRETGVRSLFVKGLTLAALAYPKPLLKMGWDIDLLVAEAEVAEAAAVLAARGYRRAIPPVPIDLRDWHVRRKESLWSKPEQRLHVELHTRLTENRRLVPTLGLDSPLQQVEVVSGISLPTLADEELFAYLAVHGASSAWFRLKWISDFAALLWGRSAEDVARLYRRSQQLGAGRAAGQALLLADSLFGVLQDNRDLRQEIASDRATRFLYRAALNLLCGEPREPTERRFGTLTIHWTQFLILPDLSYKFDQFLGLAERVRERVNG
jgi:hypothetical protein